MASKHTKDKRRQQLIDATIDSIAKRGLTETTITHISKGAGLSRGIINFYFTSKENMMQACLRHLLEEKDMMWQEAVEKETEAQAKLNALITVHFERKLCQTKKLNVLTAYWGHAATHKDYSKMVAASDDVWLQTVGNLWQEISGADTFKASLFATRLHALIRGLWLSFLLNPTPAQREEYAQQCLIFAAEQEGNAAPVMPATKKTTRKPVSRKKAKPTTVSAQMDIEDLFTAKRL